MKKPMKFAAPKPADRPAPGEDFEFFAERMAAAGNGEALRRYQAGREAGLTHEDIAAGAELPPAAPAELPKSDRARAREIIKEWTADFVTDEAPAVDALRELAREPYAERFHGGTHAEFVEFVAEIVADAYGEGSRSGAFDQLAAELSREP